MWDSGSPFPSLVCALASDALCCVSLWCVLPAGSLFPSSPTAIASLLQRALCCTLLCASRIRSSVRGAVGRKKDDDDYDDYDYDDGGKPACDRFFFFFFFFFLSSFFLFLFLIFDRIDIGSSSETRTQDAGLRRMRRAMERR